MSLREVEEAIRAIEALQPTWSFDTPDGTLDTFPDRIYFFTQTEDGVIQGDITAYDSMGGFSLRLFPGCTLRDVDWGDYDITVHSTPMIAKSYVTLTEGSFHRKNLILGFKSTPVELEYLQNYFNQIATPMIQNALRITAERFVQQREEQRLTKRNSKTSTLKVSDEEQEERSDSRR